MQVEMDKFPSSQGRLSIHRLEISEDLIKEITLSATDLVNRNREFDS